MQGLQKNSFTSNSPYTISKQASIILVLTSFCISLLACGGGSSSGLPPNSEPNGKVSGVAFIGLVETGNVTVYAFNGGVRGGAIKTTTITLDEVTAEGKYSTSLQTPSKPILVCLSSAKYREITKLDLIDFKAGQELCAVDNYVSGRNIKMALTYYSHIASGLAKRLVTVGVEPAKAVSKANKELENWVSYNVNTVTPTNLSIIPKVAPSIMLPKHRAGFANAAISVYSGWVNGVSGIGPKSAERLLTFNSILFAQRAYDDIVADGVLDGRSATGPTGLGAVPLSTKIYRHDIALDMLVMANNKNNKSGMTLKNNFKDTLFVDAARYSRFDLPINGISSTFNIFGNVPDGAELKNQAPIMNNFIIPKVIVNDPKTGAVKFAASLTDTINQINRVEYHIINTTSGADDPFKTFLASDSDSSGNPINLSRTTATLFNLEQTPGNFKYPDGSNYQLKIIAFYNVIGDPAVLQVSKTAVLTFGNVGTKINGLNPSAPVTSAKRYVSGTFNMFAGISNPNGVSSVDLQIDNAPSIAVSNFTTGGRYNVPIFRVNTLTANAGNPLTEGPHDFKISATDGTGTGGIQDATVTASYTVDNTKPTVSVNPPTPPISLWYTTSFNVDVSPSDGTGSGVSNYKILVDGQTVVTETALITGTPATNTHTILAANVPDGVHSLSVQITDNVGLTHTSTPIQNVNTDKTAPTLTVTPTSQTSVYTLPGTSCMLNTVFAKDLASGVDKITIDSVPASAAPIIFNTPTTAVSTSLQNLIPTVISVGTVTTVNFNITAIDIAGNSSTPKTGVITVTPDALVANSFTCVVTVSP